MNDNLLITAREQKGIYPIALGSNLVMNYAGRIYKPLLPTAVASYICTSFYSLVSYRMKEFGDSDTADFYVSVVKDKQEETTLEVHKGNKTFVNPCLKQVSEIFHKIAKIDSSVTDETKFKNEFRKVHILFKRYYEECTELRFFVEIANQDRKEPLYLEGPGFPYYFVERRIDTLETNRCNRLMFYYFKEIGQELYGCSPDHVNDTRYRVKDIFNRMKDHCEGSVHEVRILDKLALL